MSIIITFGIALVLILYGGGFYPSARPFTPTITSVTYCLAIAIVFAHLMLQRYNRKQPKEYGYDSIAGARGSY